jgi:hypothetical protein
MVTSIRLAIIALLIGPGIGVAQTASVDLSVPSCPSQDVLATRLRAEGFTAPAANNFAHLTREDCLAAR